MRKHNRLMIASCALALLLSAGMSRSSTIAAQGAFDSAIFDIVPDGPGLASLPAQGSTFLITGKVYPFKTVNQADCSGVAADTPSVGTWRAWGEAAEDNRIVSHQSLQLDAFNGAIELQGPSGLLLAKGGAAPASSTHATFTGPTEVLSVVGGLGTFRSVAGEAHIRPYCQTQSDTTRPFRYDRAFCFLLVDTPRRGNR